MSLRGLFLMAWLSSALAAAGEEPAPAPDALADRIVEAFQSQTPLDDAMPALSMEEARAVRARLQNRLVEIRGPIVGYKAALTNPAIQQRLGIREPVWGTLHRDMLRPAGTRLPARCGVNAFMEGDVLVRVGHSSINNAITDEDVLAGLDAIVPFVEIPDPLFTNLNLRSAAHIVAVNGSARLGIVGEPVPTTRRGLQELHVDLYDENGQLIGGGGAQSLMGNPFEAVRWLRDALRWEGIVLQPGDLLSLGTMTRFLPIVPGRTVRVVYQNLSPDGPVEMQFHFEPEAGPDS
jgi:2-keto-4-pentenoate hydratase